MATPIRIKRSAQPGKRPTVDQLQIGELALNTYDGELVTLRDRFSQSGIATEVVRVSSGATVTNVLYVTKDGIDTNTGKKLGDAKATIAGAVAVATTGTIIRVSAGSYIENNPVTLPSQVSIVGDSLREVSITPQNSNQDLFYVSPGNYVSDVSFTGTLDSGKAVFAFDPIAVKYFSQSPYINNCTNFIQNSIGMKIDGQHAIGPFKSMVTDSFTQYNSNGVGVSVTNDGYAQIVSLFTINSDVSVYAGSGGQCDITNSNSSFGNYGLVADGVGARQYTGIITTSAAENSSIFEIDVNVPIFAVTSDGYDYLSGKLQLITDGNHNFEVGSQVVLNDITLPNQNSDIFTVATVSSPNSIDIYVGPSDSGSVTLGNSPTVKQYIPRPFDGQAVYFNELYKSVKKITITNSGDGYTSSPNVTISDPSETWGITATATATVVNGKVTEIDLLSEGRGYTSNPSILIDPPTSGTQATASLTMDLDYYLITESTPISSGITTITVSDTVPYAVGVGSTVPFFKQSRVLASGHSFEYIGSGTDLINSLPSRGGIPIQENETDMRNGGLVVYTSTDQTGNFRIGDGIVINQQTSEISGDAYTKSLFSNITPYILALGGE